jgi:hypothetical protein
MSARLNDGSGDIAIEGLQLIDSTLLVGTVPTITLTVPSQSYDLILTESDGAEGVLTGAYTALNAEMIDDLFSLDGTDLWSDPPSIQAMDMITLGLTVRRQGGISDLVDVKVDFYLDAPSASEGGSLIGFNTAPLIEPNGTAEVTIIWNPPAAGQYTWFAVIDPDGDIPEYLEDNNIISRTLTVLPLVGPVEPVVIDSLTINDGALETPARRVSLDVSASSGSENPDYLLYVEYQYIQSQRDWVVVGFSGWLPYGVASLDYAWQLQPSPGVHYIQVWAADSNGLVSLQPGLAFINYLPTSKYVIPGEIHLYHYGLLADDIMKVELASLTGDADLYVWDPFDSFIEPSPDNVTPEVVTVTASIDGIYQVEVEGFKSAHYDLAVTFPVGKASSSLDVQAPVIRGRGRPLSVTLPDEKVGLPETPVGESIFLPILMR